jgi:hypothetical protein
VIEPGASEKFSRLYDSFRKWAERGGEYVLPQKRWRAAMEARKLECTKREAGLFFGGIRIHDEEQPIPASRWSGF